MPITQDRMIALLQAALDYRQALGEIQGLIAAQHRHVQAGKVPPAEALRYIADIANNPMFTLKQAIQTSETIAREQQHWQSNARRNVLAKRRTARSRQRHGQQYNPEALKLDPVPEIGFHSDPYRPPDQPAYQPPRASTAPRQTPGIRPLTPEDSESSDDSDDLDQDNPSPINGAWDESDPENAFASGKDLAELYTGQPPSATTPAISHQPSRALKLDTTKLNLNQDALGGNTRLRIDRQIELMDGPEGHQGQFMEPEGYQTRCQCGWEGRFEEWQSHTRGMPGQEGEPEG